MRAVKCITDTANIWCESKKKKISLEIKILLSEIEKKWKNFHLAPAKAKEWENITCAVVSPEAPSLKLRNNSI